MNDHGVIELQVPNSSEYVSIVRNTIVDIARQMRFGSTDIEDLRLAVGEACANAVRHGCSDPSLCAIRVLCHVTFSELEIEICNRIADNAVQPSICAVPDTSREGGMGLYLMRKLMDEVDLNWQDGWATVKMVKRLHR